MPPQSTQKLPVKEMQRPIWPLPNSQWLSLRLSLQPLVKTNPPKEKQFCTQFCNTAHRVCAFSVTVSSTQFLNNYFISTVTQRVFRQRGKHRSLATKETTWLVTHYISEHYCSKSINIHVLQKSVKVSYWRNSTSHNVHWTLYKKDSVFKSILLRITKCIPFPSVHNTIISRNAKVRY